MPAGVDVWLGVGPVVVGDGLGDRRWPAVRDGAGDDGVRVDGGAPVGAEDVLAGFGAGCTDPAETGRTQM